MLDRFPATALSAIALVLLAVAAHGEDAPCIIPGVGAFTVADGGLDVVTAERADLHPGDRLLQLNGRRLETCADLGSALQDAQQKSMLAVVALRRGETVQTVLLALPRATIAPPVATVTRSVALTPTPLPLRSDPAALAPVLAAVKAFGDQIELPITGLEPYSRRFNALRESYREQRARDGAVAAVDPIIGYYEVVAAVLNYRERIGAERVTRDGASGPGELARVHLPASVIEYSEESEVADWFRRYPFLEASIQRAPYKVRQAEYTGLWKPDEAIRLLVERARRETAALTAAP